MLHGKKEENTARYTVVIISPFLYDMVKEKNNFHISIIYRPYYIFKVYFALQAVYAKGKYVFLLYWFCPLRALKASINMSHF